MTTEIPDNSVEAVAGWIGFDSHCAFCCAWVRRFQPTMLRRGFRFVPLPAPGTRERSHFLPESFPTEIRVLLADGRSLGGADAVVVIARRLWWGRPFAMFARLPGAMPVLRATYRFLAVHRYCLGGTCRTKPIADLASPSPPRPSRLGVKSAAPSNPTLTDPLKLSSAMVLRQPVPAGHVGPGVPAWLDWLPLAVLPVSTFLARRTAPAWTFIWLLSFALFFGCKWLTWRRVVRRLPSPAPLRSLGYLLAWPGMDATAFFLDPPPPLPSTRDWLLAALTSVAGAGLVSVAARSAALSTPLISGWLAMVGVVLFLHFGLFQLLALAWQSAGIAATPLMRAPLRSTSLSDFWNRRWNTAFHSLAQQLAFRPLVRRWGARRATIAVFLISGLVHEVVISVPARGGYGLPTLYFLIQGLGVLLELRRPNHLRLALPQNPLRTLTPALNLNRDLAPPTLFPKLTRPRRSPTAGWLLMALFTAVPAPLLFHPPFIHNVILPMVHFISSNWTSL